MQTVRTRTRPGIALAPATSAPEVDKTLRLKVEYRAPGELKPSDRALHIYNRRQRRAVSASIKKLSICRPILVDAKGGIIDGQLVWEEAMALKLEVVPAIYINHLSAEELRLLRITLNKTATMREGERRRVHQV